MDMAGPDAHLQHHRRVGRLGQREAVLHRLNDGGQIGARIEQPDLRFHGKGVAALLRDGGALTEILAQNDQRPASDAAGRKVGQCVTGHIGAGR